MKSICWYNCAAYIPSAGHLYKNKSGTYAARITDIAPRSNNMVALTCEFISGDFSDFCRDFRTTTTSGNKKFFNYERIMAGHESY